MLNNNAELDNGVYNENEQEEAKEEKEEDALMGMDHQIEDIAPVPPAKQSNDNSPNPSAPISNQVSQLNSNKTSNLHSLNTSQVMVDEEKVDKMQSLFGFTPDYIV